MTENTQPDAQKYPVTVSIVVPLLNEEESLRELHDQIVKATTGADLTYEIVFVDDGSSDGSFELIRQLHQSNPNVRAIRFRNNYGKSAALAAGFRQTLGG